MVSRERDASKVALVALIQRLRAGGFQLLDTQMTTPHLARLGVIEVGRADFERKLAGALAVDADWHALDSLPPERHQSASSGVDTSPPRTP